MKTLFTLAALIAVAIVWGYEKKSTAHLRVQIDALRLQSSEVDSLRREKERLQQLQPNAEELATLQREAAERARLQRELAAREEAQRNAPAPALKVGEWLPPSAWKNRGHANPTATVETTLWAAAGGDVARVKDMLQFDDRVRAKAEAILARLPEKARALYDSPEQFIAAFMTKSVPLGDAQLVWQHQEGPDDASVCVFVKDTDSSPAHIQPTVERSGPIDLVPPMAPQNRKTRSAYMSLRRTEDGWRIVVPEPAVDKIAKDLGASR
jgi:hypothetical protein